MGKRKGFRGKRQRPATEAGAPADESAAPKTVPKTARQDDDERPWSDARLVENLHFSSYYKGQEIVPDEEWDALMSTLRSPLPVSFRFTGCASDPSVLALRDYMKRLHLRAMSESDGRCPTPVPFYPHELAWSFDVSRAELRGKGKSLPGGERPAEPPPRDPAMQGFHQFLMREQELGAVSRQEVVSMIPPLVLGVQPHHRVLDMCAAPGSKTLQLIEQLDADPAQLPTGFVVANDSEMSRCRLLTHQTKRLASPRVLITNHEAQSFPSNLGGMRLEFDRVLCDVPCSGDGTLRKSPDLWKRWADKFALGVHRLQLLIATRGAQLLTVGGRLVYSTCSMNPIENEAIVCALLRQSQGALRLVDAAPSVPALRRAPGVTSWRVRWGGVWHSSWEELPAEARAAHARSSHIARTMFPPPAAEVAQLGLDKCLRVMPHHQNTGGFFVALFEKLAPLPSDGAAEGAPAAAAERPATERGDGAAGTAAAAEGDVAAAARTSARPGAAPSAAPAAAPACAAPAAATAVSRVRGVLHGTGEVAGAYDKLFDLQHDLVEQIASFYGFDTERLPLELLVARSETSRSIYYIAREVRHLLESDVRAKMLVIHTGVRLLEWTSHKHISCSFRLCQEGLSMLVGQGLMRRQIVTADVGDLVLLHQKRQHVRFDEFTPDTAAQLRGADVSVGCFALVAQMPTNAGAPSDAAGTDGGLPSDADKPVARAHQLVCAAMKSARGTVDVLVSKTESHSFIAWTATLGISGTRLEQSAAHLDAAAAQGQVAA